MCWKQRARRLNGRFVMLVGMAMLMAAVWQSGAQAGAQCTQMVASGNPDYPPYLWRDPVNPDRLIGANADLLKRLGHEIGVDISVIYGGPWSRVQEDARTGEIDLIAGAFFTLPRLDYMDYVYPAFQGTRSVIWVRDDFRLEYSQWTDLQGLEGATVINNSFGQDFDSFAKQHLTLRQVPTLEQSLKMLSLGRADYVVYEEYPAQAYMTRYNIEGIHSLEPPVSSEELYLTLSHKSKCNTPEMRGKLSKALYELVQRDTMKDLIRTNLQRWGVQTN